MKKAVEVIVLDLKSYSENSLWVCFFSKENGLQNGIFKGGKKKKTKALVLGIYEFIIYKPSEDGLQTIISIDRLVPLEDIFFSPEKVLIAFFLADSYKCILINSGSDASFYSLVKNQITTLNKVERPGSIPIFFLAKLIDFLGYRPLMPKEEPQSFDIVNGVFNPTTPSLNTVIKIDVVKDMCFVFNNTEGKIINPKESFDVLVDYAKTHISGFNLNKSIDVIRDVLYN